MAQESICFCRRRRQFADCRHIFNRLYMVRTVRQKKEMVCMWDDFLYVGLFESVLGNQIVFFNIQRDCSESLSVRSL